MQRVAICGVGLIGGSFALALRRTGFTGTLLGVSSERTIAEAVELGVVDRGATLEEAAQTADLIYLAQPILKIIEGMPALGQMLGPQATVTDAGSTKAEIVAAMREYLPAGSYVGGHPMAGKETRGVRGARVVILGAEEHDRAVAYTSHLTQLVATALAGTVTRALPGDEIQVSGPGLIDTTRLAQSSYDIWRDILCTNRGPVDAALGEMIDRLREMRAALGENEAQFAEGAELRRRIVRSVNLS